MKSLLRSLVIGLVGLASFSLTGCGSDGSQYTNNLTFGTGIGGNGFELVNEGTAFTAPDIWFKLESADDMAGRAVRLLINDGTYGTKDYQQAQDYGHYLLSSFRITDAGAFVVKAYLLKQVGPDIADPIFVAQSTLTMK